MSAKPKKLDEEGLENAPPQLARAERLRQKGDLDDALRIVSNYMNDNFDDVGALMLCAHILTDAERFGMAHVMLKRATQLKPDAAMIWNNLGLCYQEGSDKQEGEAHYWRAIKLNPEDALAHCNLGVLYVNLAQPARALKHLNIAIEHDPALAEAYYNRALANIALGNYKAGWAEFDSILGSGKIRKERIYGMVPRWNGVEEKNLIAYGEQGLGEEIAYASCIPDLARQNKVVLECNPRLAGLFRRSFGLETHGTRFKDMVPWLHDQKTGALRKMDGAVALGSLPQFYRTSLESYPGKPYLVADPERRLQWRALLDALGPKMKVGIAWTGGNKNTGKARRSIGLDDLLPVLRQDATFVSLQYMDSPEILQLQNEHGIVVHHWRHALQTEDYDDTAALVAELDLVISVTTAVIHLSGALGQKCWVMCPKEPRWFYGISGESMPWYESVKLYRQKHNWVEQIAEVATDLRNLIHPIIRVT